MWLVLSHKKSPFSSLHPPSILPHLTNTAESELMNYTSARRISNQKKGWGELETKGFELNNLMMSVPRLSVSNNIDVLREKLFTAITGKKTGLAGTGQVATKYILDKYQ